MLETLETISDWQVVHTTFNFCGSGLMPSADTILTNNLES